MRHLITGGAGFIGSHLADALVARGDEVLLLDDLSTGRRENVAHLLGSSRAQLVVGSTGDAALVDRCVRSVDACLHLASAVGVKLVTEQPLATMLANVRGNEVVMEAAARHGRRLLFTSTSEVYGKSSSGALREDDDLVLGQPALSRWSYAIAKALGEALAHAHARDTGAEVVVARLFNTVGPRQTGAHGMVLPRLVRQALGGEPLTVHGDGRQTRCFVHVADTVRALIALHDAPTAPGRAYNVGNTVPISVGELAERVLVCTGSRSPIRLVPYAEAYAPGFEELGRRRPDTARVRALTGWTPQRTLDEAIADVVGHELAAAAAAVPALADAA